MPCKRIVVPTGALLLVLALASRAEAAPEVPFLASPLPVDGIVEPALAASPARPLSVAAGAAEGGAAPVLRLAYGADALHLAVEFAADALVARDRGYQNGDGLVVILAEPKGDGAPSARFVVLAFSGGAANASSWARRLVWYENVGLAMRPAGDGILFAERVSDGRAVFEVRIPWDEVQPFHPWLGDVGLNVMLVQARGDGNVRHLLVADGRIDSEGSPRFSERLRFARPVLPAGVRFAVRHDRNTAEAGALRLRVAAAAAKSVRADLTVRVLTGEGDAALRRTFPLDVAPGLSTSELTLPLPDLVPSGYRVEWRANSPEGASAGGAGLTVLPRLDAKTARAALAAESSAHLSRGSVTTLRFLLDEAEADVARLHPADTASALFARLSRLTDVLAKARAGEDVLAARTGTFRRAFASSLDGTLQPYSVRVPSRLDAARRAPPVVYLHGSGQDDTALGGAADWIGPPEALIVAPFARGTSHAYDPPEARADIADALADAASAYGIEKRKAVLTGFSMGGYGVLRAFAAAPDRWSAVAVFSGQPDMGPRYGRPDAPDFLDPARLAPFRGVPVFVFHGRRDRNCPFEKAERLAALFRAAGARVTFVTEDVGHEKPPAPALAAYREWLRGLE